MKSLDIFGLMVRAASLLGILYVVRHLARVWHKTGSPHLDHPWILITELGLIVVGLLLILFATSIAKVLCGSDSQDSEK